MITFHQRFGFTLLAFTLLVAPAWAEHAYDLIDLGPDILVRGIGPDGVVFGQVDKPPPQQQAALFNPHGTTLLGLLPEGNFSDALGRDGMSGTVGYSSTGHLSLETHAFLRQNGRMQDLGTTGPPERFSAATGLNRSSAIGYGDSPDGSTIQALVWSLRRLSGRAISLPTLGGASGYAYGINGQGVIVGQSDTANNELHATMWIMNMPHDLTPNGGSYAAAWSINDSNVVVGETHGRAWRWTPSGGEEDLGTLPGHIRARLLGINKGGTAVGASYPSGFVFGRAIIVRGNQLIDLNELVESHGLLLTEARGISTDGSIAGMAETGNPGASTSHGFLLRPKHQNLVAAGKEDAQQ